MSTLMQASAQWANRPADERFTSLREMQGHFELARRNSRERVIATRSLRVAPTEEPGNHGLEILGPDGGRATPSHWAFGQLAGLAEAPSGYLRTMPSPIVADCLNWGLQYKREVEDIGLLLARSASGDVTARAATGPRYGRIWNEEILRGLIARFGDGELSNDWTVPGTYGQSLDSITKANTTLFAGDRDMFVFLANERNRIEIPDRRNGEAGELARGFFVWNSEVGSATFGIATFLFDYVCQNRIVWGARQYRKITLRHTPKAPIRWADEFEPALRAYAEDSTGGIVAAIAAARAARIEDSSEWLAKRFGKKLVPLFQDAALDNEGRPIETIWDAVCAITAYARGLGNQDERVELERKGGDLLDLLA